MIATKSAQTVIFKPNANTCTGRVQVQSVDSNGKEVSNTNVFVNNVLKGTTDSFGLFESQQGSLCGDALTYTVKCPDNAVCESKTASMEFSGEFEGLQFDCTVCTGNTDLKVNLGNVNISTETNKVTVNITTENIVANDINLTIKAQDKTTGLISQENSILFNINSGDKSITRTPSLNLNNVDFVHVYVDPNNKVSETDEKNNYVAVPVITNKVKAYVSVDTGLSNIDNAIKDYLSLFTIPTSQSEAELIIVVSILDKNQLVKDNRPPKDGGIWYANSSAVYKNGQNVGLRPYTGIVAPNICIGCQDMVFAIGKDIDGTVAAVKRLVNARTQYLTPSVINSQVSAIDDLDVLGISVFDIMHNDENKGYYRKNNANFANVVTKILTDNNYEIAIKTVRTTNDNTTLRLKNLNSDFSAFFQEALTNDSRPIVFSGGLWNDLFYWEKNSETLIKNLINKGRNLWEIEITGGSEQDEKSNSPNYKYNDTRDYYWPALIAGVQQYSGENSLQYVGHSNGCGLALASINQYQASGKNNAGYYFDTATGTYQLTDLSSNAIDTFAGEGCPGALDEYSFFYDYFGRFGDRILAQIPEQHIDAERLGEVLAQFCNNKEFGLSGEYKDDCTDTAKRLRAVSGNFKVSKQLLQDYLSDIKDTTNQPQVDSGLSIRKFKLYSNENFGSRMLWEFGPDSNSSRKRQDVVVSQQDSQELSDRISSTNSIKLVNLTDFYHGRVDFEDFTEDLEVFIND